MKDLDEKIVKLPVWAQEHIQSLKRQKDDAETRLKEYLDSQSPTSIYTQDGWPRIRRFIQSDRICFALTGGEIEIAIVRDRLPCIQGGTYGNFAALPSSTNVLELAVFKQ